MWLSVEASVPTAAVPAPFFQSGAWDATTGVLTRDAQLKIYEVALGVAGAAMEAYPTQFHFVRNQIVFQDNRIPPSGFDTQDVKFDEMAPVPASLYPTTAGGRYLQNWDDTSYRLAIPATATGDVQVVVKLLYQTASKDYIDFLQANGRTGNGTTTTRGDDMKTVWQNHGKSPPVVMATQTFTITNTAPFVPLDAGPTAQPDLSATVEDMAVPGASFDMEIPLGMKKPKHGCGVSVAGADWTDLGPLASLLVVGVMLSLRRRRSRS